jgi:hypothetical protein
MLTKPHMSPFHVSYDDLVASAEERLRWLMLNRKPGWKYTHDIEVQKKMVALLKKFKKDPQINLFDEFEKLKK